MSETNTFTPGLRIWINGDLYANPAAAQVSAVDHGLVAGDGVFEVIKVDEKGPFATTRHLDRLTRSAERLGLPRPDHKLITKGIEAVCADRASWEVPTGRLRITYTDGVGPLASNRRGGEPLLVVAAEPSAMGAATERIITVPWTRNVHGAMTGVKTTSYGENVRALAYAKEYGGGEAIFANSDGNLCEGTGSNIFCVFGDRVVTPPLSAGPLDGITRALVLEWSDNVSEEDLTIERAKTADEVFLTSTTRDVQPVTLWDETRFEPGPVSLRLREEFATRSQSERDPK